MDETSKAILTVSGVLFGFLFSTFWWIVNRELRFKPERRHFKLSTGVLLLAMFLLAAFGIVVPLRRTALANTSVLTSYRGILLTLISIYGYMLIELGHHGIFQWPKSTRRSEKFFCALTLLVLIGLVVKWWFLPWL